MRLEQPNWTLAYSNRLESPDCFNQYGTRRRSGESVSVKRVLMTLLLLATLPAPALLFPQAKLSTNRSPNRDQSLKITTIGEGDMFGRHATFRTYETSDHIEALVWYGEFRSEQESKHATKLLLKEHMITDKEPVKDLSGQVIGNRIVAAPKDGKKAFMVIRTHGLNYRITQSISLAVAMQVDGLIEPSPPLPPFAEIPPLCDRSAELLSKQQRLSRKEQKKVHQVRGMVAILISADGDVADAKVMSEHLPRDGNKAGLSSGEGVDVLLSQARSMKFKRRPGCGNFRYEVSF